MTEEELNAVFAHVTATGVPPTILDDLRDKWPDLHFTHCSDDDVCGPRAVREGDGFNLYMIAKSDHCISFTPDLAAATGIVVAEIEEED